jgi:hypothetical protein
MIPMLDPYIVRRHQPVVLKASGITISIALGAASAFLQGFLKADPDDPLHPGWPAGTPEGRGGKFRPKDGTTIAGETAVRRQALRRAIRAQVLQTLSLPAEIAAIAIPVLGEAAEVVMVAQLAATFSEFRQLDIDTKAALDFLANGPYSLADLRVREQSEAFSSYAAFYKGECLEDDLAKRFGRAGDGYQYHHIVEQGGANANAFSPQQLQNTDNIVRIPTLLHQAINSEYSVGLKETSGSLRQQLESESFSSQYANGIKIMKELGIIK